jgi:hypothetical protein
MAGGFLWSLDRQGEHALHKRIELIKLPTGRVIQGLGPCRSCH